MHVSCKKMRTELKKKKKGGRVFSLDAALGLLAHAGAWGAGVILPPCAQLLWCELYVMKSTKKNKKKT